jgi:hypothetical protein
MPDSHGNLEKPSTTLPGTVQKIIKSPNSQKPEQAEIVVENAEELYREIRVDNKLCQKDREPYFMRTHHNAKEKVQPHVKDAVFFFVC